MSNLHISTDGGQPAQYDESKVKSMLEQGQLREDSLYWKEGMKDWEPLRNLFPASPYAPPASDPVAPPPFREQTTGYAFTRNPLGITRFLKVMLWIHLAGLVLALLSNIGQAMLVSGGSFTAEAAEANDQRQAIVSILSLVVYLVTTIVFGRWIYLANLNCRGFGAEGMKFTPGWSVGYYFIPFINLVRPYQAMKEIWLVSSDPRNWQNERRPALLPLWWTLWLLTGFTDRIASRLGGGREYRGQAASFHRVHDRRLRIRPAGNRSGHGARFESHGHAGAIDR